MLDDVSEHLPTTTDKYIRTFSDLRKRPRASKHQVSNVVDWLDRGAIDDEEAEFVTKTSDLMSINSVERLPIRRLLESWPQLRFSWLFREKLPPDAEVDVAAGTTTYASNERLQRMTNGLIILVGLAMMLAPLWWCEYVENRETKLKIITGFVCAFIAMMMTATINKPFEVVAATAAYSAVLMVFMQIDSD